MTKSKPQLIVALDVNSLAEVRALMTKLDKLADIYKVGSQLFTACGPAVVRFIEAKGKKVFLDLKYHDIPNTVSLAVGSAVGLSVALARSLGQTQKRVSKNLGLFMLTIHTLGGEAMLQAAVESAAKTSQKIGVNKPLIVGITVLTSGEKNDTIPDLVLERARLAKKCGLNGVVASSQEAKMIRKEFGKDFVIVTPGIRPQGSVAGDQQRITTPREAVLNGSDYLVVGRPIVNAPDPKVAAQKILEEINSV